MYVHSFETLTLYDACIILLKTLRFNSASSKQSQIPKIDRMNPMPLKLFQR